MFLLLCIPQLQDWQTPRSDHDEVGVIARLSLFGTVLGALRLNGNANGHSSFLLLPQVLNWLLFFCMSTVLLSNFLQTLTLRAQSTNVAGPPARPL